MLIMGMFWLKRRSVKIPPLNFKKMFNQKIVIFLNYRKVV